MNKKHLITYYVFCILIVLLMTMFVPLWACILFAGFLILFPVYISKVLPKLKDIPELYIIVLTCIMIWVCIFYLGAMSNAVFYENILKTENLQHASEIYRALEIAEYSERTEIRKYDFEYHILMEKNKKNNLNKDEVIFYLAEKGLITPDVHLDKPIEYKNNNDQFEKELNRRLNKIINQMTGVSVRMSVCSGEEKACKSSCGKPIVTIWIDVDEDADKTYIEKVAKTVVLASVKDLPAENIKTEFVNQDRKMPEARKLYKQKKYDEIFKLFSKHPENYEMSIKMLKRLIELDKKIAQNPNDYLLYVERADIKAVPVYAMFKEGSQGVTSDYKGAIEDYTKALELNPSLYELYEKRGDVHIDSSFVEPFNDDTVSRVEAHALAILDYENAIKYTGGNDRLFEKLGNEYYSREDYQNAYRIYSMINPEYIFYVDNLQETYIHSNWYLIYKVTNCFVQVGEYDKAIELCNEGIKNIKVKELVRRLKFRRLNLKVRRLFHIL